MADHDKLARQLDDLLPQTQCQQCGHAGCTPYAKAMAEGAPHNLCPPGGDALQQQLAHFLQRTSLPLEVPADSQPGKRLEAVIREEECIGCTKCIAACPVDAIVGARQFMHTVISHECTGCELCVAPCPVDCIDMVLRPEAEQTLDDATRFHARARFEARNARLARKRQEEQAKRDARRKRQSLSRPIDSLPETPLTRLKADWQKAKHQQQQVQAALAHQQRHGLTPSPEHQAQLAEMTTEVERLKQAVDAAMNRAKQQIANAGASLTDLKLAATRSELALRRAQAKGADAASLAALQQAQAEDQTRLMDAMRDAGLADAD